MKPTPSSITTESRACGVHHGNTTHTIEYERNPNESGGLLKVTIQEHGTLTRVYLDKEDALRVRVWLQEMCDVWVE